MANREKLMRIFREAKSSDLPIVQRMLQVKEGRVKTLSVETKDGTVYHLKGGPVVRDGEILVQSK